MFSVSRREKAGGKPKHLRRNGVVPMALVERSHQTIMLQASINDVRRAMRETDEHGRLDVQIEGEGGSRKAMIKHVEADPLGNVLLSITLQEVSDEDEVRLDVPVVAVGRSEDSGRGDVVMSTVTDHVKLRGRVADIPERLEVDVSKLHMGGHINAGDVALPQGVTLISSPEATLFSIQQMHEPDLDVTPGVEATLQAEAVPGTRAEAEGAEMGERRVEAGS